MVYLLPTTNNTIPVTGLVNNSITSSGSFTLVNIGSKEINLIINVSGSVTGTSPTLTFTLAEIDPGNTTTQVGTTVTGAAIIATGTQTLKLADTITGAIKVTWTIGGTSTPTFNGVYGTITLKNTEDVIEQFIPSAEDNTNGVIAQAIKPISTATYAPSMTSGLGTLPGNIKGAAGNLYSIVVSNANAATRYACLFNSTGAPSGTPLLAYPIAAGSATAQVTIKIGTETFTQAGLNFSTGITFGISTSGTTYTAATGTDHYWTVIYF